MLLRRCVLMLMVSICSGAFAKTTAIIGGTVIDLNHSGRSNNDLLNAVVLIREGKIVGVGPERDVAIPPDAERIDARGKYLIPGLIDGFGALRTESFARAYLYEGVTTVYVATILVGGGGDGELKILKNASPGPRLLLGAPITGYSMKGEDPSDKSMTHHRLYDHRLSNEQLVTRVDQIADEGYRGITISYDVWPDQMDVIIAEAKRRGLATLGEPGLTTYPYTIRAGIDVLLRNDHYQMELAPAVAKLTRADEPGAGVDAYHALCATDPQSALVDAYGKQLAASATVLMPTLALEAADSLDIHNPWNSPSAKLIDPGDLDVPVDRATGASGFLATLPPDRKNFVRECGWKKEAIDSRLYRLGTRFLAGSSAASYGVMPGSGLHLELELLHRIGLSPREALAAATANFAEVYSWSDVGKIEAGRDADLLILSRDPRLDLSALDAIDRVILNGATVDRNMLLSRKDLN